jgi:translocation protein SEC62
MSQEDNENKKQYDAMVKLLLHLENKGLVVKNANLGRFRGEYYRGKDFEKVITDNQEYISTELEKIKGKKPTDVHNELYQVARKLGLLVKGVKEEGDKLKYPKRLFPLEGAIVACCDDDDHSHKAGPADLKNFDPNSFYILKLERAQTKLYLYLGLSVLGVLMYTLMPVWPLPVKLAIWYVSYVLLIIMVAINILRYSLFIVCYIFGISFWLFPDLYDDKVYFDKLERCNRFIQTIIQV